MKPVSVSFQCFGPYMDRQHIDFTQLEQNGLFLICGETGAGKTTILDAICYALYCESSGGQRGDLEHMRCKLAQKADETQVEYIFESGGERYKFSRSMKYKTKNLHKYHNCYCWREDQWELLDTGLGPVNARAEKLVGLSSSQFRQVIILPQGKFEEFLVSDSKKKEDILVTLFDVQQWGRITEEISRRVNKRAELLHTQKTTLDQILRSHGCDSLESLTGKREAEEQELAEVLPRLEAAEKEENEARKALQQQLRVAEGYEELNKRKKRYDTLMAQEPQMQLQGSRLLLADRAEQIRQHYDALCAARREKDQAVSRLETARGNFVKGQRTLETTLWQLEKHQSQQEQMNMVRQQIVLLENAQQIYARLQSLQAARDGAQREYRRAQGVLEQKQDGLKRRDLALEQAFTQQGRAKEVYTQAQIRYRQSIGGILAATLEEGKPCPVCGSTHHPDPASGESVHISEEELDRLNQRCIRADQAVSGAIAERSQAERQQTEAQSAAANARQSLAEAEAACRGAQEQKIPGIETSEALEKAITGEKRRLTQWENEGKTLLDAHTAAEAACRGAELAVKAEEETLKSAASGLQDTMEIWEKALSEVDFASEQAFLQARMDPRQTQRLRESDAAYRSNVENARKAYREQEEAMKDQPVRNLEGIQQRVNQATQQWRQLSQRKILLEAELGRIREDEKMLSEQLAEYRHYAAKLEADQVFARRLLGSQGVGLQRYVLGVMMNAITVQANRLLSRVYAGRYSLYRTDETSGRVLKGGLELEVYDSHNNQRRSVRTLSGGEKFLVALSLAIGLSAVVQAQGEGIRLEAMFIDEGFGSLDREAIQDALEVLQGIQRTAGVVGIISHVEVLQETIPARIEIRKTEKGSNCRVICP